MISIITCALNHSQLASIIKTKMILMKVDNIKTMHNELSTEIKLLVPMTLGLLVFSYWFKNLENGFYLASLLSLILVLLIDYFIIVPQQFPKVWNMVKWLTILGIVLLTLTSFF